MSGLDWALTFTLGILYIALLFTVCVVTFRKGHWVMGLIGFFFLILWLIGAVIPPVRGGGGRPAGRSGPRAGHTNTGPGLIAGPGSACAQLPSSFAFAAANSSSVSTPWLCRS